jgi:COPII coat assembly protein SEC16
MTKPSLDSTLTWLEGRFAKLITGDGDSSPPPTEQTSGADGPFSHYSTISSATTSARSSPQPSINNPNILPPRRSGSAMGVPPVPNSRIQIDRASSAMDYIRHKPLSGELSVPPVPRVASASAATTTFAQSQSFGQVINGYSPSTTFQSSQDSKELLTPTPDSVNGEGSHQEVSWWGSSYATESSAATPTATAFLRVDESTFAASSDGFISLMDDSSLSVVANAPAKNDPPSRSEEDEEDLGFGNSASKRKATPPNDDQDATNQSSPATERKAEPAKAVRPGEYIEL